MIRRFHAVSHAPCKYVSAPKLSRERLIEWREACGLHQREIAPLLGYSATWYSKIETGEARIPAKLRLNIRQVLMDHNNAEIARLQALNERIRHEQF